MNLNREGCTKGRQQLLANLKLSQDFPVDGGKSRELLCRWPVAGMARYVLTSIPQPGK
jgi:hypothetical protein